MLLCACLAFGIRLASQTAAPNGSLENRGIAVLGGPGATIRIRLPGLRRTVLRTTLAAEIGRHWITAGEYPRQSWSVADFHDRLGEGHELSTRFYGMADAPALERVVRVYRSLPYAVMYAVVRNTTSQPIQVETIRVLQAAGRPRLNLGAAASADRVLASSFSEDPAIQIAGLKHAPRGGFMGVDSLLVYNRRSRESLLLAALTTQRFLTVLRLLPQGMGSIGALTVDSTGTTAAVAQRDTFAPTQRMPLELTVSPGKSLASEKLMLAGGRNYFRLLDRYGRAVRRLHHARFLRPAPLGWWSWTAFYAGINAGEAMTNARWLAQHLLRLGFNYFHIDEGYQYARGEYTTPNATQFPFGMRRLEYRIHGLGLTPAIWTAPFEVSERSRVYRRHRDWLVKDAHGKPIRIGYVTGHTDALFVLDTTRPGAQAWLRRSYRRLVRVWGIRAIKLDFMDSAAIEGRYFRPNTTALEAQRIGLKIIRAAVGEHVLLDKDGSPMLNPVGLVQAGRISVDTGHSFQATRDAAANIAARYFMNRYFYTADPDAFSVTRQLEPQERWHQSKAGLTRNEAEAQIVLAALAGGMYEIGDDLPTLGAEPRRLALVENRELLALNRLGRSARPLDLMTFPRRDGQPSVFFLSEDRRQAMLAIFNFTDAPRSHRFSLAALGFSRGARVRAYDVLDRDHPMPLAGGELAIADQAAHSVRLVKLAATAMAPAKPRARFTAPAGTRAGQAIQFSARLLPHTVPALACRWNFGDGTGSPGHFTTTAHARICETRHVYTYAGRFRARVTIRGLDGPALRHIFVIRVSGFPRTKFELRRNRRYRGKSFKQPRE